MALTREEVVEAAVDLLDEVGFEGLTLRSLARRVGVSAPTLYWHIDDKRHLLDLMVDVIYGRSDVRFAPEDGEDLWEWLVHNARAQRAALLAIRDAALVVAGNRPTEGSLPWVEGTLSVFLEHGIEPAKAIQIMRILHDYVIGNAVETQSLRGRVGSKRDAKLAEHLREDTDAPLTMEAITETREYLDSLFEQGLRWFVQGLRGDLEGSGISDGRGSL